MQLLSPYARSLSCPEAMARKGHSSCAELGRNLRTSRPSRTTRSLSQHRTGARRTAVAAPSSTRWTRTTICASANDQTGSTGRSGAGDGAGSTAAPQYPQMVLETTDKDTGTRVILVGCMHYNPYSIHLASSTVRDLAEEDQLASVVLETCPTRWERTMDVAGEGTLLRHILDNEMQAAAEPAAAAQRPVVLGDQRAEDLGDSLWPLVGQTFRDCFDPFGGGWARVREDISHGWREHVATDGTGLGLRDLRSLPLLVGLPVTFVRYPLAFAIKAPTKFLPFAVFIATLAALPSLVHSGEVGPEGAYIASGLERVLTGVFAIADILEPIIILRVFLVALLAERNEILTRSIKEACAKAQGEGTVVAVLGAAHSNGIKRALEQ